MIFYYLDASAWIKRYYSEAGTAWVENLFANNPTIACASLGLVEIVATLARKRKARQIDAAVLELKLQEVEEDWRQFIQIQFTSEVLDWAKELAQQQALRGADAIHLASAIVLQSRFVGGDELILITSDEELKKAAQSVGLDVVNPAEIKSESGS